MNLRTTAWVIVCCIVMSSYTVSARSNDTSLHPLTHEDLRWLNRVTFGVNSETVERYQQLGRSRFFDEQLRPPADDPPELATDIRALSISQKSAKEALKAARSEQQRIQRLDNPEEQQRARMVLNQQKNKMTYETAKRQLMRNLYSPWQLREQLTWFWMNHFSVFSGKGDVAFMLADYENNAVRLHALGYFRDLVLATLKSPAMLIYLDNAQSAVRKINENYARELMELHTLGVSGGPSGSHYSQQDVQELARVLTGVGIIPSVDQPQFRPVRRPQPVREGAFEFNPNRHDFGTKKILNETIKGTGMDEVEHAVSLLCRQPATARFISMKLATYFVSDNPPRKLVDAMVTTFKQTDGNIAAVLGTMFTSSEFIAILNRPQIEAGKFKDPVQFVVSSLRLAYDSKRIINYRPVVNWLQQLGEPLYGRMTPDGYPLEESAWTSLGQIVKRFEITRAIGNGNARLFDDDDGTPRRTGFPMLASRLFYDTIEPTLSAKTRTALDQATSQQEWNMLLLASPDWMVR
ncbi:DUF1800 domain-containing protein [Nitrosomonas sp. Is37]|uniref:DUF1800 domain-containing protein n=1 Tax=Nitrosomonas sp. Is37 TaxID=3080535 RepID=UPI00294ADCDE|nr:DUF1800 domain-containing protein [Nitrosomonas sp. Is37]MDV6344895.1 DUF1800 domain-containing protein [Nitrosomonas sp. Is37]